MPLALVTGGTAGIGAAFAEQLAAQGHDLVLVARRAERLASSAAALRARYGVDVATLRADLTEPAGRAAVEARLTAQDAAPVDVLVSNAGIQVRPEFLAAPLDDLQTELDVNVSAVLRFTHLALTGMVARGHGSVVLVSSFAGILGARGSAYAATRAWAVALADTLAPTLVGTGVHLTAVCPGYVRTESLPEASGSTAFGHGILVLDPEQVARRALADHHRGRVVSVPGIAHRAVWTGLELPRRALRAGARLAGRGRPSGPTAAAVPAPRRTTEWPGAPAPHGPAATPAGVTPVERQRTP